MVQGHGGDAHVPGSLDEIEYVVACGLRVAQQELGDGAGKARQQFAVGSPGQAVMGGLDSFFGGSSLVLGSRGSAEADEACDSN